MWVRLRPAFQGSEVAPLLAHADVRRHERPQEVFVEKQTVRLLFDGPRDVRIETEEGFQSRQPVYSHAQINHHEVRIGGEIDGAPIDAGWHR